MDHNSAAHEIKNDTRSRVRHFVQKLTRYQTRRYDIFNRGSSDIQEDIENYFKSGFKEILKHSINEYKSTDFFKKYAPYSDYENRYEQLKTELTRELINKGETMSNLKFISLIALYILAACDLKDKAGFHDAPKCVAEAITEAFVVTSQHGLVDFWYDSS